MDKNNNKSNKDFPQMLDFDELTRAYSESLNKVTFGGKPIEDKPKRKERKFVFGRSLLLDHKFSFFSFWFILNRLSTKCNLV